MDRTPGPTVGEAIATAGTLLRAAGSPTPRLDAEVLLAHVIGRDRTWLVAHADAPIGDGEAFEAAIARRAAGEPVAYIRGFKEWHSLRIRTDARALIPRPETELLADAAIAEVGARLAAGSSVTAWDVGTGSGAVMLAMALDLLAAIEEGRLVLVASDVSPDALALAAENLEVHDVRSRVRLLEADLLPADAAPRPDVVTANLPYVASTEVELRQGSLGFEPRIALDGGVDGLDPIRRLLADAPSRVRDGATILLEIGIGQVDAIRDLAPAGASVEVVPDLAGLDRVVRIAMPTLAR